MGTLDFNMWILSLFWFFAFVGLKEEIQRKDNEVVSYQAQTKENQEKIKLNKQLPYLVSNIVEVWLFFLIPIISCNIG